MSFPERLRLLRTTKGDSREDIAKVVGLSWHTVAKWETGKRDPDTSALIRLSEYFRVTTDYLLGRVDNPMEKLATPEDFAGETIGETVSTIALSRRDNPDDDLPEEAQKQIEEFRAYIRQKYKKPE